MEFLVVYGSQASHWISHARQHVGACGANRAQRMVKKDELPSLKTSLAALR